MTNFTSNSTIVSSTNSTYVSTFTVVETYTLGNRSVTLPNNVAGINPFQTCFRPDVAGSYSFQLTVFSSSDCPVSVTQSVTMTCNQSPLANAGLNQTVFIARTQNQRIILSAINSSDPENAILTYSWVVVSPIPSSIVLSNPYSVSPSFIPNAAGVVYMFQVTVSDGCSSSIAFTEVQTLCASSIPLSNASYFSTYDGSVPVRYMTLSHDYRQAVQETENGGAVQLPLGAPSCESYAWTYVDYSTNTQALPQPESSTPFVRTAAFAGLISAVGAVVVFGAIGIFCFVSRRPKPGPTPGTVPAPSAQMTPPAPA